MSSWIVVPCPTRSEWIASRQAYARVRRYRSSRNRAQPARRCRFQPAPVVGDSQTHGGRLALELDPRAGRVRMLDDVVETLLDNAVKVDLGLR